MKECPSNASLYDRIVRHAGGSDALTADMLARYDELHVGGAATTADFLKALNLRKGQSVLDAGSGLGGPARRAATGYGVKITGIDANKDYVNCANSLSALGGAKDRTHFIHGDMTALRFDDQSFDGAFTIHACMNIKSKNIFFNEIHRVIKSNGCFGLYDVTVKTEDARLHYPLPWADKAENSFLETSQIYIELLGSSGFKITDIKDRTEDGTRSLEQLRRYISKTHDPAVALTMGPDYKLKIENLYEALQNGVCAVTQIICFSR